MREEHADVLTVYDPNGGYGHPDHRQVHRVGTLAARLAGTPVVLEATVPAGTFRAVLRLLRVFGHVLGSQPRWATARCSATADGSPTGSGSPDQLRAKRAAMAAHTSQRRADGQSRVMELFCAFRCRSSGWCSVTSGSSSRDDTPPRRRVMSSSRCAPSWLP